MKTSQTLRRSLLTLGIAAVASTVAAQGTIEFRNSALTKIKYLETSESAPVDAPVGTVVGLFWGQSPDSLTLASPTVVVTTPGLFNGGTYPIAGTQPGQVIYLKAAAWFNKDGATPLAATAGAASPGITHYGETETVSSVPLGPTAGPGTVIWNPPSRVFALTLSPVPEPSVAALGAVALSLVCLRSFNLRRRT